MYPVLPPSPRLKALLLALFAAALPAFSPAKEVAGGGLSLDDAIRTAVLKNWDLLAAKTNIDLNRAQELVAREFPNPTFSLGTTKVNVDGRTSRTGRDSGFWSRNYDTIAAVGQLIELGGKRTWRQLAAKQGLLNAEASFQDAERQLKNGVIKAYAKVLQEDETVAVLKESEETLTHEAEITRRRLDAGDVSEADKQQIDIAAERFAADREVEEASARSARIALETLMGEPKPRGDVTLSQTLSDLAHQLGSPHAGAKGERPDLVAAEALVNQLEASVGLQKAVRIPDVTLQVQYEHEPPDQPNTAGLGFSIPLPLWNRNKGNIAAAEAQKAIAEQALAKVRSQVVSDANTAWVTYQSANDKWKRYVDTIRPKSKESLESLTYAYRKGGIPLVALLTAQRNDNDIRTATSQAALDTVSAAADVQATRPYGVDGGKR